MIAWLAIVALQVACVVHLVRNGRPPLWLAAIVFLPLVGSLAYFVVEILPGLQGNRHVRTARAKALDMLDPERELRAAHAAVDLADTSANRMRLADALAGLSRWEEALPHYRDALARAPGEADGRELGRYARALYESGAPREALALLGRAESGTQGERDQLAMLRARILGDLGDTPAALAIYADIVTRVPGEEARCRYAALLIEAGQTERARGVLEDVEARMRHLDRQQRAAEADMYRWATDTLRDLRGAA